jgi:DNA polymerase III alpha subunit
MYSVAIKTHYSILQSYNRPSKIIAACKAAGITNAILCDSGTLSGSVEFLEACKEHGLKAVIGCNFNGKQVFAKNLQGWKDLVSLVTEWACDERLNQDTLGSSNLLTLSLPECRYGAKEEEEFYRILRALALKAKVDKLEEPTSGFELRPLEDPSPLLDEVEQYSITGPPKLPRFESDKSEIEKLRELVEESLGKLLPTLTEEDKVVYRKRVEYEMKVIEMGDLAGYFLIVQDFVNHARDDGQLCSIARGSSAGSLVLYLVRINLVCPMPYGLLFSRFYNAARSYPKHLSFDEHPFIDEWRDYETKYS